MLNKDGSDVPVLLIAFNRPKETQTVLDGIRLGRPKKLYISIDGARANREGESEAVEAVAKLAEFVDWPCDVKLRRSSKNQGCCLGVSSAISWLFDHEEAGIILEDDCLADPTFFPFCAELLDRYSDDERVGMIAGTSMGLKMESPSSYGFSQYSYIWGWASWRRAWALFDAKISDWPTIDAEGLIEAVLDNPREVAFWKLRFSQVYEGTGPDNWDYQWMIAHFLNRMACIVPRGNLVSNIGSGPGSTHMNALDPDLHRPLVPMQFPIQHPKFLVIDSESDRQSMLDRFSVKPFHRRVTGRIRREVVARQRSRKA